MLLLASSVCGLFKWRQFEPEVILAVSWYLRFSLSYRDVEELLAERGLFVDHVTVWRWVQSALPIILGGLAHDRRLRSDPYDPQRPTVLECSGDKGRSAEPLHSWPVRGDELKYRSSTQIFASTTNLQHFLNSCLSRHIQGS